MPMIDAESVPSPGKPVIGLASAGAFPAAVPVPTCRTVPAVPTIDGGKRAESGQGGHRPGKRRGLPAAVPVPTCRAVPVVPTFDAGKLVIGLATCRPWCR
jgi:hypothetical protein